MLSVPLEMNFLLDWRINKNVHIFNKYYLAVTKLRGGATPPTSLCTNGACYNKLQQVTKQTHYKKQGGY